MNTVRSAICGGGIGTQSAALGFGGEPVGGAATTATESYNGTNWTTVNSMNTDRETHGGAGTQTAGLAFGGGNPSGLLTATELWNGTSWTSNPTGLATAKRYMSSAGTQTAALSAGGSAPSLQNATEEWTGQALLVKTITVS